MITGDAGVEPIAQTMPGAGFGELMAAVLAKGASVRFQANGFSMSPFIRDGDMLTIAPSPAQLRRGEVAAFVNPWSRHLTVHRVLHVEGRGYLFCGDNAPQADGYIPHSAILGRVIRVEHHDKPFHLGLGPEGVVIAFLSQRGWSKPVWLAVRPIIHRLAHWRAQ